MSKTRLIKDIKNKKLANLAATTDKYLKHKTFKQIQRVESELTKKIFKG